MFQNNFTTRAQEALQTAHLLTAERNHQELTATHLLLALIRQTEGIVASLLSKMEITSQELEEDLEDELQFLPRVSSGGSGQLYISKEVA